MKKKQIVVLGGGFGGLTFCKEFKHKDAEVTLIDRQNHHLFQPLLYQVATAGLSSEEIAQPLRGILAKRQDIRIILANILDIDQERQEILLDTNTKVNYDYLIIALGGQTSYFGNKEWEKHAPGLKSLDDALTIRRKVLLSYEKAESIDDQAEHDRLMTMVVVGAGPTGVEVAGSFSELAKTVIDDEFHHIEPREARIVLIEGSDRVLPNMDPKLSAKAKQQLEDIGVEIRLNTFVKQIEKNKVHLEDETIECGNIIWTAGVQANALTQKLDTDLDRGGRIKVEPTLKLKGKDNIFAIGDIVNLVDPKGVQVPGVSPAAIQMAQYVAKNLKRSLSGIAAFKNAYTYWDKGTMATIGKSKAVADVGPLKISGFLAWLLWLFVHLVFLVGFKNRVFVFLHWVYGYFSYRRGARIILGLDRRNRRIQEKQED